MADIAVVFLQRAGKCVTTTAIGDEIQGVAVGRVDDRFNRRHTGSCNRSRRQAVDAIGIVGVIGRKVGARQSTLQAALAVGQAIGNRRVRLQAHALFQAVQEHRRDPWPFFRQGRFLFNDRRKGQQLIRRLERKVLRPFLPRPVQRRIHIGLHAGNKLGPRLTALEVIRLGQQAPLADILGNRPLQHGIGGNTRQDLCRCQPFRNGQTVNDRLSRHQQVYDVAGRRAGFDQIFTGLEPSLDTHQTHAGTEYQRPINDTGIRQTLADAP